MASLPAVLLGFLVSIWLHGATGESSVYLQDNGYRRLLIGIDETVPENQLLLNKIEEVFAKASEYLFKVTRRRAYFKEISVVIPKSWSSKPAYHPALNESFDVADVQIDYLNNDIIEPYVMNPNLCGEAGHYMHLHPDYLLHKKLAKRWGPYEKVIVHEWAHLRWGVYDEYPVGNNQQFLYASRGGDFTGVRCSLAIKGELINTQTGGKCYIDPYTNQPPSVCRWQDKDGKKKSGSLMYKQYLKQIDGFCDNDKSDPRYLHNREAPNQQNRKCKQKSVWEVMREHEDFAGGSNPPLADDPSPPVFRYLQVKPRRTVLVLDTSGSMLPFLNEEESDRLLKLRQACRHFLLEVAKDGDYVGIVVFNGTTNPTAQSVGTAYILSPLEMINNDTRQSLIDRLPTFANGHTSIGKGLQLGLDVLSNMSGEYLSPEGGHMVVVSDGEENCPPFIEDVELNITEQHIVVDSIAISEDGSEKLENLARLTKGSLHYFRTDTPSNGLNEAFLELGKRGASREYPIQLLSEGVTTDAGSTLHKEVYIDKMLGRNTEFFFSFDGHTTDHVLVDIATPNRQVYNKNSPEYELDPNFRTITIRIENDPQMPTIGLYDVKMTNNYEKPVNITLSVTSLPSAQNLVPVTADAKWSRNEIIPPLQQAIFTVVSKGYNPVLYANVTSYITRPGETTPFQLTLLDNGLGADAAENDGVYSAFFTEFTQDGRYSAKVIVTNKDEWTAISQSIPVGRSVTSDDQGSFPMELTGRFQRTTSSGMFTLVNYNSDEEYYPPADITDLRVASVDRREKLVSLQWTAPGRSLDSGAAYRYTIYISDDFERLETSQEKTMIVPESAVATGNLTSPGNSGTLEIYVVNVTKLTQLTAATTSNVTLWFAVRTFSTQEEDSQSSLSNMASASLKTFPVPEKKFQYMFIIVIIICALLAIFLISVGIYCCSKRCKRKEKPAQVPPEYV